MMVRDARSDENARAIQDSESNVAIMQKRMIECLAHKGWSKNEILGEVQRVWGQDVIILPEMIDDTRSTFVKFGLPMLLGACVAAPVLARRMRIASSYRVNSSVIKQSSKEEIFRKLKI